MTRNTVVGLTARCQSDNSYSTPPDAPANPVCCSTLAGGASYRGTLHRNKLVQEIGMGRARRQGLVSIWMPLLVRSANASECRSARAASPIWIPLSATDHSGNAAILVPLGVCALRSVKARGSAFPLCRTTTTLVTWL